MTARVGLCHHTVLSGSKKEREVFHYATTRDYSKDDDENWDCENDEEAYEEYWREVLGEDEEENTNNAGTDNNTNTEMTGTTGLVDGSSEEKPEAVPPRPKLSLRFKEVCCTLLTLMQISILPVIFYIKTKTHSMVSLLMYFSGIFII